MLNAGAQLRCNVIISEYPKKFCKQACRCTRWGRGSFGPWKIYSAPPGIAKYYVCNLWGGLEASIRAIIIIFKILILYYMCWQIKMTMMIDVSRKDFLTYTK